ncbi:MAG: hypothetical protein IM600_12110 [Bacteroidetes bacterium]|jgi:hypothetical protein|nr:hypothetical protein [Bacteroidota bacterium]MCA6444165.1 hypothetical protein [Bacteroidota bacterium]
MSTYFETGHPKNVANLLKYIQFLQTLGTNYNPSNASITLAALTTTQTTADTKQTLVKTLEDTWKNQTNLREIAFNPLNAFTVQLFSILKTTDASEQTLEDFLFLVNKMRGSDNASTKTANAKTTTTNTESTSEAQTKSTSQQSFDQKIEHFSKMILILTGVTSYTPNEVQFQLPSLNAQLANLTTLNTKANNAKTQLTAARIDRNTYFYAPNTGWLDVVKKSKEYIGAVFGKQSQQYKAAIAFKFVRVIAKKKSN